MVGLQKEIEVKRQLKKLYQRERKKRLSTEEEQKVQVRFLFQLID